MSVTARFLSRTKLVACLTFGLLVGGLPGESEAQSLLDRLNAGMFTLTAATTSSSAQVFSITVDGIDRRYLVYVPVNLESRPGAVIVLHGGRGTAEGIMEKSAMNAAADEGGFLAVYPEATGEGARWNSGTAVSEGGADDIAFLRAVIDKLKRNFRLDTARVFATGISSGGSMLYGLACQAPGLIRAVAPVSANMSEGQRAACAPGKKGTPIMMFSGTDDPLMVYTGGEATLKIGDQSASGSSDPLISAPDTLAYWANANGCGSAQEIELPDTVDDGTTVTEITYSCNSTATVLYRINGGGHSWPGSTTNREITGPTSQEISATGTMVQFFRRYGL